jgi:WD40 repeat protein
MNMGSRLVRAGVICLAWVFASLGGPPAPQPPDKPARTDRHGDVLPSEAITRLGSVRFRIDDAVIGGLLGFTQDGKTLVWHGRTGAFTWDAATGRLLHRFPDASKGNVFFLGQSLSPDGKLLAVPSQTGAQIWEVPTAKLVRTLGTAPVFWTSFSPDGKTLAIDRRGGDDPIELWDVAGGRKTGSLKAAEPGGLFGYTADGKSLITSKRSGLFLFWDLATGKQVRQFRTGMAAWRRTYSPDGKHLALTTYRPSGSYDDLRLWDVIGDKELRRLVSAVRPMVRKMPYYSLSEVAFLDDQTLLTVGIDDTIIVWDLTSGKERRRFGDEIYDPVGLAIAPERKTIAVATGAASIRLFDLNTGKERQAAEGSHPLAIQAAVVIPDGRTVATAGGKAIMLWDPATGMPRGRLEGHQGYVTALRLLPDGRTLLSSAADHTLRFWDVRTAKELRRIEVDAKPGDFIKLLAVSRDGLSLAFGGVGSTVVILDAGTGKERGRLPGYDNMVYGAAFGPDERTLVSWDNQQRLRVWGVPARRVRKEFAFPEQAQRVRAVTVDGVFTDPVAVSPDGRTLAYGGDRGAVALYDLATGEEIRWFARFPEFLTVSAFTPDGKTLALASSRTPTVHLVEVVTGQERYRLSGANAAPTALAFSADGKRLISGHVDTTCLVWDLTGYLSAKVAIGKALTPAELDTLWGDLAGLDAEAAFRAIRQLAASPEQAVPLLKKQLRPVPPADEKRIAVLLPELDSGRFAVHDQAARELEGMGEAAVPAFQRALKGKLSFEARRRVETLLDKQLRQRHSPSPQRLQALRSLEVLELIGTPVAYGVLGSLAGGTSGAQVTEEASAVLLRRDTKQ